MSEYPFSPKVLKNNIGPLVRAISRQKSVLYVGAGASMPAGLPSWEQFLKKCLARAKSEAGTEPARWEFAERLLYEQRDYLAAAELLQIGLGSLLERYIWEEFTSVTVPSPVHHALARIRASLVVTVNYDRLLETAFVDRPNVWTWRDPDAFFSAIRNRRFAIIKTHGDVGNAPSLVLTKTQYRDLIHQNEAFNACFRTLLSHRTFLFVGTSLRDPDLIQLMDSAKLELGTEFGPHYAILFDDEVDKYFARHLRNSYNLRVIVCRRDDFVTENQSQTQQKSSEKPNSLEWCKKTRCSAVVKLLTEIGGLASKELSTTLPSPPLDDPLFSRKLACQDLIDQAVSLTGSFRGDICLIESDGMFRKMQFVAESPLRYNRGACETGEEHLPNSNDHTIPHDSVMGSLFLRHKQHDDFIYLPNVNSEQSTEELNSQGFSGVRYHECHPDVKSELAVPITNDGQRVGVLNLESELPDAYTRDHLAVATRLASAVGWVFHEARQRQSAARILRPFFDSPDSFKRLMYKSRMLSHHKMEFILWELDYDNGTMKAHSTKPTSKDAEATFHYPFSTPSLATRVLTERREVFVDDAHKDLHKSIEHRILARKGVDTFNIHGPISGVPIQKNGTTCAILVAWSDNFQRLDEKYRDRLPSRFGIHAERVRRIAQLLANKPVSTLQWSKLSAEKFVTQVDSVLQKFDGGDDSWWFDKPEKNLTRTKRHEIANALLECLVSDATGIQRVRLWLKNYKEERFILASLKSTELAYSEVDGASPGEKEKVYGNPDDPYVEYTIRRFENDPLARHQHSSMFPEPDENSKKLHKDTEGMWIVGPIVSNLGLRKLTKSRGEEKWSHVPGRLLGYISADNHIPVPKRKVELSDRDIEVVNSKGRKCVMRDDLPSSPEVQAFQRCVIDVITDVLAWVVDRDFPIRDASSQLGKEKKT